MTLGGVAIATVAFVLSPVAAEQGTLRLGEMELSYDTTRWRAEPASGNSATMRPIGDVARKLDPVVVDHSPAGDRRCEHLARGKLAGGPYDEPTISTTEIAGRPATRITAHTRCRNAMPRGVVICIEHRGAAYLLSATAPSCRSGGHNLFSGIDPLKELADGIRFLP